MAFAARTPLPKPSASSDTRSRIGVRISALITAAADLMTLASFDGGMFALATAKLPVVAHLVAAR
jgi:hypothetical protein